jgi:hypothetical protein
MKKHLYAEQMQVENQLNNNVIYISFFRNSTYLQLIIMNCVKHNLTNVGQLSDLNDELILNVKTPPGDNYARTYRKDLESMTREIFSLFNSI